MEGQMMQDWFMVSCLTEMKAGDGDGWLGRENRDAPQA
jgi:hypothetical protein